ncbi:MAG: cupin domain-containing protein [Pseudomonadota bacterium]
MAESTSENIAKPYLSAVDISDLPEAHIKHPFNPRSDVFLKRLAPVFGLERLALYVARVPPGKESFAFHRHERDEEFLIILSGKGRAEIGKDVIEVGPGDIMGFPAPYGPPHHLTNPYTQDLIYLMGGESSGFDIAHFPKLRRKLIFSETGIRALSDEEGQQLSFDDWLSE